MKLCSLLFLTSIILGGYGMAEAQSVSLDHTDGLIDATHLDTGVPVTFHIRFAGDGSTHGGVTNGFRIYSDNGATWGTVVGDTVGISKAQFDLLTYIEYFSVTGSGADTVGFRASRLFGPGLLAGFNDIAYTLEIGPLDPIDNGKSICLDSTFFPPNNVWKWAGPDVFPAWDGPHCFIIGVDGPPPIVIDFNCSGGGPDISDLIYLVMYMFQGGPPPYDTDGDGTPDCQP
jgi:hypothetical protein